MKISKQRQLKFTPRRIQEMNQYSIIGYSFVSQEKNTPSGIYLIGYWNSFVQEPHLETSNRCSFLHWRVLDSNFIYGWWFYVFREVIILNQTTKYTSTLQPYSIIKNEEGIRALYKIFTHWPIHIVSGQGVTLIVYEIVFLELCKQWTVFTM